MIIIKTSDLSNRRYVDCDCVVQNGVRLTPERCTDVCNLTCGYLMGISPPNYQLPAIIYVAEHDIEYQRCTDVLVWRVYDGIDHCPCLWECVYSYLDTI
jgi:hypothetical protein